MEAIILVGGLGTRLAHIVSDCPKPMAIVAGKPFLTYILDHLCSQGVTRAILATGHMSQTISDYFGNSYKNIELAYSVEDSPLGTGGAIKKALDLVKDSEVFIVNGDTYFDVNFAVMHNKKIEYNAEMVIATKCMENFDRYGSLVIKNNKILKFNEKKYVNRGKINGGVYLIEKSQLDEFVEAKFSYESDYLEIDTANKAIFAVNFDTYFIDIGVPEDYYKANEDFAN